MKIFIFVLAIIAAVIQLTQSATLRRKPKVYNALITTDQNLTPSRAFPIIQSHLQETYSYPSYSYRSYAPLGLYNNGFQYGSAAAYNGFHSYPRINTGLVEARNFYPRDEIHSTLPPIQHEFGLPPSLVPINSFAFGNLAPYPYHSYPIVYDQFGGYGKLGNPYLDLPPYPFYPPGFDPVKEKGDGSSRDDNEKKNPNGSAGDSNNGINDGSAGLAGSSVNGNGGSSGSGGSSSGSGGSSNGSGSGSSNGSGSGSSNGSGSGSSNGSGSSGGGGSSSGNGGRGGVSSGGSSGGTSGSSSSSSTSSSTKSSRSRNFDKLEHPQQQLLNENIKNFPNKDPTIPDIDPLPPVRVKPLNK